MKDGGMFGWYLVSDGSIRQAKFLLNKVPEAPSTVQAGSNLLSEKLHAERPLKRKASKLDRDAADTTKVLNERLLGELREMSSRLRRYAD